MLLLLVVLLLSFTSRPTVTNAAVVTADYQPSDTGGSTAGSITCVAPANITTDDLLIIVVGDDADNTTSPMFDNEAGWTKLGEGGNNDSDAHIAVYYLVSVSGSEGNVTIDHSSANDELWCMYFRVTGADTTTPIDTFTFGANGSASPQTASAISAATDNELVITGFAWDGGDTTPYTIGGTGWSQLGNDIQSGSSGTDAGGAIGERSQSTAGSGENSTCTASPADGAAYFQFNVYESGSAPEGGRRRYVP